MGALLGREARLGDGVDRNNLAFRPSFPYLALPSWAACRGSSTLGRQPATNVMRRLFPSTFMPLLIITGVTVMVGYANWRDLDDTAPNHRHRHQSRGGAPQTSREDLERRVKTLEARLAERTASTPAHRCSSPTRSCGRRMSPAMRVRFEQQGVYKTSD